MIRRLLHDALTILADEIAEIARAVGDRPINGPGIFIEPARLRRWLDTIRAVASAFREHEAKKGAEPEFTAVCNVEGFEEWWRQFGQALSINDQISPEHLAMAAFGAGQRRPETLTRAEALVTEWEETADKARRYHLGDSQWSAVIAARVYADNAAALKRALTDTASKRSDVEEVTQV